MVINDGALKELSWTLLLQSQREPPQVFVCVFLAIFGVGGNWGVGVNGKSLFARTLLDAAKKDGGSK